MKASHFLAPTEPGFVPRPLPTKARSAFRPLILSGLSALAIFLSATAGVRADQIGSQGFNAAGGVITVNTGDVTTGTVYDFTNFGTTHNQTGVFVGMPIQTFGPLVFDLTSSGGAFGNSVFGTFTRTSITTTFRGPSAAIFDGRGLWTPGTFSGFSGLTGRSFPADFTLSFTQTGGTNSAISFSGTFAVSTVPEPSSIVMVITGLIAGVVIFGFGRSRRNLVLG